MLTESCKELEIDPRFAEEMAVYEDAKMTEEKTLFLEVTSLATICWLDW